MIINDLLFSFKFQVETCVFYVILEMIHKLESFMRIDTVVSRNTMMYLTKSHKLFDLLFDFWSVSKN